MNAGAALACHEVPLAFLPNTAWRQIRFSATIRDGEATLSLPPRAFSVFGDVILRAERARWRQDGDGSLRYGAINAAQQAPRRTASEMRTAIYAFHRREMTHGARRCY